MCYFTGQTNATKTPPPREDMECACTDCDGNRCNTTYGCFSLLKLDDEKAGYITRKGCIGKSLHYEITCKNAHHPVYCCGENMCNWNVTPPVPTTEPGRRVNEFEKDARFKIKFIVHISLGLWPLFRGRGVLILTWRHFSLFYSMKRFC